jgi:nicotinamide-nucleotide amidase
MARQVNQLFLSDWGLAITGYASPVPEENITELFACYAICYKDKEMISKTVSVKKDSPEKVRLHYTKHILSDFADILGKVSKV